MHGLGFAGALSEIGLPQNHLATALLTFNLGVELGQLLAVAVAWAAWRVVRSHRFAELSRVSAALWHRLAGRLLVMDASRRDL